MPAAKKPQHDGRFCPECHATLTTSAKGWVYCPNKYTARACSFKGFPSKQGPATSGVSGAIPILTSASEEQLAIMTYCQTGKKR